MRKLHYERKRTAGYSFWPMGGWTKLWDGMAEAIRGARRRRSSSRPRSTRVVVENGAVRGSSCTGGEVIEADEVVVSAPVWDLPQLFDDGVLPWDLPAADRGCCAPTATAPAGSATGSRRRSR